MAVMYRQGDVFLIRVARRVRTKELTQIARESGSLVLAHGEVTGHKHQITDLQAYLYAFGNPTATPDANTVSRTGGLVADRLLDVRRQAVLRHEEHDPINIPAGQYVVRIQREYTPGALRNVVD